MASRRRCSSCLPGRSTPRYRLRYLRAQRLFRLPVRECPAPCKRSTWAYSRPEFSSWIKPAPPLSFTLTFTVVTGRCSRAQGEAIVIYSTGLGPVSPAAVSGAAASTLQRQAHRQSQSAESTVTSFTRDSPRTLVSIYQVNVTVPAGLSPGTSCADWHRRNPEQHSQSRRGALGCRSSFVSISGPDPTVFETVSRRGPASQAAVPALMRALVVGAVQSSPRVGTQDARMRATLLHVPTDALMRESYTPDRVLGSYSAF